MTERYERLPGLVYCQEKLRSFLGTVIYNPARRVKDLLQPTVLSVSLGLMGVAFGMGVYFLAEPYLPEAIKFLVMPGFGLAGVVSGLVLNDLINPQATS